MILKEIPSYERPREKVINQGIKALSNVELIALLLHTGSKEENVLRLSENLLYRLEKIDNLKELTINELTEIKGIGKAKAITILAAVELGSRLSLGDQNSIRLVSSRMVYNLLKDEINGLKEERLYGLYLNAKGCLISKKELTKGTITMTLIDAEIVFKWYYKLSASAVILVHNHPSGDENPSVPDLKMTEELVKRAKLLKITVLDHIIIGNDFYSMKENNKVYKIF